jgi:hypothetical protein
MKKIRFEIEEVKLAEMGIDQPIRYAVLYFNPSQLIGYWISTNVITFEKTIVFYIGSQTFNSMYCEENIELLNSILNESSSRNNNL